jgi:hypothetical protein
MLAVRLANADPHILGWQASGVSQAMTVLRIFMPIKWLRLTRIRKQAG